MELIDIIVELAISFQLDQQAEVNDASLEDTYDGWIGWMLEESWDHSLNFFTFICDKDELLFVYGISEEELPEWLDDNDDTIKQRLKSTLAMKGFW